MADFLMPSLGADMAAGTLVAWRKRPGERVARGEIIAEVETEKGVIEIECFASGVLAQQLVAPGTKVPVGTKLATIEEPAQEPSTAGEPVAIAPPRADATRTRAVSSAAEAIAPPVALQGPTGGVEPCAAPSRATPAARRLMRERGVVPVEGSGSHGAITRGDVLAVDQSPAPDAITRHDVFTVDQSMSLSAARAGSERLRVSPLARRLAGELAVSLAEVRGSGPAGAIVADDVRAQVQARERVQSEPAAFDERRMRAAIGQAMARSKREIPHFYLSQTVDLEAPLAWLRAENERRSVEERLLAGVLFVRAVARAAAKVPELNAHYSDQGPRSMPDVHVGVAVALRHGGLIAPAIMHAHRLSIDELSRAFKDLIARARKGQLRSSEMASATITVTSLGERGAESVLPVIIPPQVAMVGFGAISARALVIDGSVVARPAVTVTLAADHRVSDGHHGSLFLAAVQTFLKEQPS